MNKKIVYSVSVIVLIVAASILYISTSEEKTYKEIWSQSFGKDKSDEGYFVLSTDDGGCIAVGYTTPVSQKDTDLYVVKIDKNGNEEWKKNYGDTGYEYGKSIIKIDDGYIIAGNTNSTGGLDFDYDLWLLKIDFNGVEKWNYTYGGESIEQANSILQTEDKNYIIVGSTSSYGNPEGDLWIIKIDETGKDIIWEKTYDNNGYEEGRSIIKIDDGYVISGITTPYSDSNTYSDAWLLKINNSGGLIWNHTYGQEYNDLFNHLIETQDGFVMVGHTSEKTDTGDIKWNGYIVKTDKEGNEEWTRVISEEKDTGISCIEETKEGYILVGYIGEYGQDNLLIEKIDTSGKRIWMKTIGGSYSDAGVWIDKGQENNYFITGYTDLEGSSFTDLWVMKFLIE